MDLLSASEVKVSVICMAYNQEKYIEQMLRSVITQKTEFRFEVIVHDDCSIDATADIIRKYQNEYPDIVRPIYESENQYSQGVDIVMGLCLSKSKGKYIAICEGDDYWSDDTKLQRQFDVMEQHPELDMCVCRANEINGTDDSFIQEIRPQKKDCILSVEDVILGGGRYVATATHFYRRELFENMLPFEQIMNFDYTNQIKGALKGGIYYIDTCMAVYRRATSGSWTVRIEKDNEKREHHRKLEISMLKQLDIDTNKMYHETILKRLKAYESLYEQLKQNKEEIKAALTGFEKKSVFLWGLGLRGEAIQEFFSKEGLFLEGVCDKKNECIGEKTIYGYKIVDTEYAIQNHQIIIAANRIIYDDLIQNSRIKKIIDFQQYIPFA